MCGAEPSDDGAGTNNRGASNREPRRGRALAAALKAMDAKAGDHRGSVLARFVALYASFYAGFGVASPFFPALLASEGLAAGELGMVLSAASAIRLASAPLAAHLAERIGTRRLVLGVSAVLAALFTATLTARIGLGGVVGATLLRAAALAPVTVLSDALALAHARPAGKSFEYGWVRGVGSAAFVAGMLGSGVAVDRAGLEIVAWGQAALLALGGACTVLLPRHARARTAGPSAARAFAVLRSSRPYRSLLVVGALVLGSHAMHDSFAVIRWSAAGIGPRVASMLWSESVVAEVLVFLLVGPAILARIGAAGAMALSAAAGGVRWGAMALSANVVVLAAIEPLHGLTFALFHLAAMRVIARVVTPKLQATAVAVYGTCAVGAAATLLMLLSGELYARFGAGGFWVMSALSLLALPLTPTLRLHAERRRS
jgi:PPP family 3-phenylpropionic acid transporter